MIMAASWKIVMFGVRVGSGKDDARICCKTLKKQTLDASFGYSVRTGGTKVSDPSFRVRMFFLVLPRLPRKVPVPMSHSHATLKKYRVKYPTVRESVILILII